MSEKPDGIDFDRQVFVQPPPPTGHPATQVSRAIIVLAMIVGIVFLGHELVGRISRDSTSTDDPALTDLDKRLSAIEGRLEKLEIKRAGAPLPAKKEEEPTEVKEAAAPKSATKTIYQVSPPTAQRTAQRTVHEAPPPSLPSPDPAVARRLSALQQGLGTLQSNADANREAWQATTDKLADMAGQVGTQGVDILRSQDELNQLLARTEMEAIPFELQRGSNPQPVGPVSLVLKSTNPKTQRYTLCVYLQPKCIELKDRTLHEVVQFVVSRNTTPLEVIATKITKDVVLGYLENPRDLGER